MSFSLGHLSLLMSLFFVHWKSQFLPEFLFILSVRCLVVSMLARFQSPLTFETLPKSKPPNSEHSGQIETLEEIDFSSAGTKRDINKDRWPSENDIKMHRCYDSFCAFFLRSVYDRFEFDLNQSIWWFPCSFHLKKVSNMFPVSTPGACMALLWWSIHAGSMENWCRFHVGSVVSCV